MVILVFALLAVISGWVAWRRNPLFSVRSTLRFLVAVGLMLTAVIGALIVAANFSTHHSQAAGMSVMGVVVVFGTTAMIWVITVVSTPKTAPLPATAKMLCPYRKKVFVWAKRLTWAVLAWAVLLLVLPEVGRSIVGAIGGIFVFLGVILSFAAYLSARQMDRWLSAIEANPWVHWSYTAEQWKQWTEVEVARTPAVHQFLWRRDWYKLAWPVLVIAIGISMFSPGSWLARGLYVAGISIFLVSLLLLSQKGGKTAPQRLRSTLMKAEPEVFTSARRACSRMEFLRPG